MEIPSSINSEQAILGALLMDNDAIDKCIKLTEESFFDVKHQKIFAAISALLAEGKAADIVTVDEWLYKRGIEFGGIAYLADIQHNTPSSAGISRYVKIVRERHIERQMIKASSEIAQLAISKNGETVEERQAKAVALIENISDTHASLSHEKTAGEALQCLLERIQKRMDRPEGSLGGISTGLHQLDDMLDGLHIGELVVIGARPSMGKSILAENIGRAAVKRGHSVRVQAYEVLASDWLARSASSNNAIPLEAIRKAKFKDDDYDNMASFVSQASDWKLVVDEEIVPVEMICLKARAHKRRHGLDLLIIDHLALIPHDYENDVRGLSHITASLKKLAKELQICVVLVSQLSRSPAQSAREPSLSDLRGSGSIEQDADVVIFIHREWYYDKSKPAGEATLIVAKQRNGPVGRILCGFNGNYVRFQDAPDRDYNPIDYSEDDEKKKIDRYSI